MLGSDGESWRKLEKVRECWEMLVNAGKCWGTLDNVANVLEYWAMLGNVG